MKIGKRNPPPPSGGAGKKILEERTLWRENNPDGRHLKPKKAIFGGNEWKGTRGKLARRKTIKAPCSGRERKMEKGKARGGTTEQRDRAWGSAVLEKEQRKKGGAKIKLAGAAKKGTNCHQCRDWVRKTPLDSRYNENGKKE